jgi:hypothetical protein
VYNARQSFVLEKQDLISALLKYHENDSKVLGGTGEEKQNKNQNSFK